MAEERKPKGYISGSDRKACDFCKFFGHTGTAQQRSMLCTFMDPPIKVNIEDICDEFIDEN